MRARLIYAFFVILTLLIVSSEETKKEHAGRDISTCQSINVNIKFDCIIPEVSLCLYKNFSEVNLLQLINKKFIGCVYHRIIRLNTISLKLYLATSTDLNPIKQKPLTVKLHYTSEKEDSYHLS